MPDRVWHIFSGGSVFYVLTGAILWGFIGFFVKILISKGFTPMQAVALRMAVATFLITGWAVYKGDWDLRFRMKDIWMPLGMGVVGLTFANSCYFTTIGESSLAVAALLLYTAPAFVVVISCFLFMEKFTMPKFFDLVLTFFGCSCISGVFSSEITLSMKALIFGLMSGLCYGLYSIFTKFAVKKYANTLITAYSFYFSLLSSLFLADFGNNDPTWDVTAIAASAGLGFFSTFLPYFIYNFGLRKVEAGTASIIATIEPFVAAAVGIAFFSEPVTLEKVAGMVSIFLAVAILNLHGKTNYSA